MPEILLFVEDSAQEKFFASLVTRLASESSLVLKIRVRTSRGGYAKVLGQVADFVQRVKAGLDKLPDGLLVVVDANCQGYNRRRNAVVERAGKYSDFVVFAIPDPHVERWFLLDSAAFKSVLGTGCKAPDEKCEKERYKRLLNAAVLAAGVEPLLGGVEYAEEIVQHYDVQRVADHDASFGKFVAEFRTWLNRLKQT